MSPAMQVTVGAIIGLALGALVIWVLVAIAETLV